MKKSDLLRTVLDKVSEECEVREESIMGTCRIQACVEARCMLTKFCRRYGLTNEDIALLVLRYNLNDNYACPPYADVKKKARVVDTLFHRFSDYYEQSYAFRDTYRKINAWAEDFFKEDAKAN